jgi:hypothetical protein
LGLAYERQHTREIKWRLQLNIQDFAEKPHLAPISLQTDGTIAGVRTVEGQTFQMTNSFLFRSENKENA